MSVTDSVCSIDKCNEVPLVPNGEHPQHVKGLVNKRHNALKYAIGGVLKLAATSRAMNYEVDYEAPMESLGFKIRKGHKRGNKGLICDFFIRDKRSNHIIVTDLVVSHPKFDIAEDWDPKNCLNEAAKRKHAVYCKWDVPAGDVVPLACSTFNVWDKGSWAFLRDTVVAMTEGNKKRFESVFHKMRDVIATEMVFAEGRRIEEFNRLNRLARGASHVLTPNVVVPACT